MNNNSNIDDILQAVNIVDIVSSYITLSKSGSNYKACCPFHEERTASFHVNEAKQIFKCFGCQKSGNAISFVRDYEKISFYEALKKIAEKAGIQLHYSSQSSPKNLKRELIYTVYELAKDYYVKNLHKHGIHALSYLQKRNIPFEIIKDFSLGYSLDSFSGLKNYLSRNQISTDIFLETGLFRSPEQKEPYDLFRERIMFPIYNINGKVVAFGGRIFDDHTSQPKYVNSPTTMIYEKGKELYGLYITRHEISKKKSVFIVEGYLDFLRMYQIGITNVVASLGTALTQDQVSLLRRFTQFFYLLYDSDQAGLRAAIKAASLIIKHECSPRIISLPEHYDPDLFFQSHSIEEFQPYIAQAKNLVEFIYSHQTLYENQRQAIQVLLDIVPEIDDAINREIFMKEIANTFRISEHNIKEALLDNSPKPYSSNELNIFNSQLHGYRYEDEKKLIMILLKNPFLIKKIKQSLEPQCFFNLDLRNIYIFFSQPENDAILNNPALLIHKIENMQSEEGGPMLNVLTTLYFNDDFLDNIDELIRVLKWKKLEIDREQLNEEIAKNGENFDLLEKKFFNTEEINKKNEKKVVRKMLYKKL